MRDEPRFEMPASPPPFGAAAPQNDGKNTLGLVAFILSVVGLLCLPVVASLPGLVCGLIAVRREPRGLAIGAIVMGAVGSCATPLLLALLLPALAKAQAVAREIPVDNSYSAASAWLTYVDDFQIENGRLPASEAELTKATGFPPIVDGWNTPMRMRIEGAGAETKIFIWSAGPDLAWDTRDDFCSGSLPEDAADEAGYPTDPIRAIEPGR
ncbi:MAG: hypothetical protein ACKO0W_12870 [Planctomycetota bacterium]